MVSAALIIITIYTITVVSHVSVSASGDVGVGGGVEKVVGFGHSSRRRENGDSQTEAVPSRGCEPHRFLLSLASLLIITFQERSWAEYVLLAR